MYFLFRKCTRRIVKTTNAEWKERVCVCSNWYRQQRRNFAENTKFWYLIYKYSNIHYTNQICTSLTSWYLYTDKYVWQSKRENTQMVGSYSNADDATIVYSITRWGYFHWTWQLITISIAYNFSVFLYLAFVFPLTLVTFNQFAWAVKWNEMKMSSLLNRMIISVFWWY